MARKVDMQEIEALINKICDSGFLPGFDEKYYTSKNPEVLESDMAPIRHYLEIGWRKNMDPSQGFSNASYFAVNIDVYNNGMNPLLHYLVFGIMEGRSIQSSPGMKKAMTAHLNAGKSPPFRG